MHSPYLAMASALLASRRHFAVRTFFWHADFIDTYLRPVLEQHLPPRSPTGALRPRGYSYAIVSRWDGTMVASSQQFGKLCRA